MRVACLSLLAAVMALQLHGAGQGAPGGRLPVARLIALPDFWGSNAIWGATGSDRRGHIWLGITSNDDKTGSAHLYELDPATDTVTDRGNVVAELERLGLRRPGERQMKIHSRIVEMPDGYLYFASMDESDENPDGSRLPTWGGHMWRIGPSGRWEHLAVARQALIAVAGGGRFVYALGYFDHVVYQYDTRTGAVNAKTVGAAGGHVSRNFFADDRGHVFVPRVVRAGTTLKALLVELDSGLREIASQPLGEYFEGGLDDSHGIVALHPDGSGGWLFSTGKGRLYRVTPNTTGPSTLTDLGWYHPSGPRYIATMFRDGTSGNLHGIAMVPGSRSRRAEWISRDLAGRVTTSPLPIGDAAEFPHPTMVYGSMARDARGRFYGGGTMNYKPFVLQITRP